MTTSIVYVAQCKTDRRVLYVGKTDRELEERKGEHLDAANRGVPTAFYAALREYGLKNWDWRVLETCPTADVCDREKHYIHKLGALAIVDIKNTAHARKATRSATSATPLTKAMRSNRAERSWDSKDANKWRQLSGKLNPVINLTTKNRYESVLECERREVDTRPAIVKSCKTGIPTAKGNRYAYLDLDGTPKLTPGHQQEVGRTRRVRCLNTGNLYESIKFAASALNLKEGSIQAVCFGKYATTEGQSFCYVDADGSDLLKAKHRAFLENQAINQTRAFAAYPVDTVDYAKPVMICDSAGALAEKLNLNLGHLIAVCKGHRSHVNGYRVAYFDKTQNKPILTEMHKEPAQRIIRPVICLSDGQPFANPTKAAEHYGLLRDQIAQCCKGVLKSTGRGKVQLRFAYADEQGRPILTNKHEESLEWTGQRVFCPKTGKPYPSLSAFCKDTGVPRKRAMKFLSDDTVDLDGFEFIPLA